MEGSDNVQLDAVVRKGNENIIAIAELKHAVSEDLRTMLGITDTLKTVTFDATSRHNALLT